MRYWPLGTLFGIVKVKDDMAVDQVLDVAMIHIKEDAVQVEGKVSAPFWKTGASSKTLNHVWAVPASGELAAGEALDIMTSRYCIATLTAKHITKAANGHIHLGGRWRRSTGNREYTNYYQCRT